jgi:hypothetical protein
MNGIGVPEQPFYKIAVRQLYEGSWTGSRLFQYSRAISTVWCSISDPGIFLNLDLDPGFVESGSGPRFTST